MKSMFNIIIIKNQVRKQVADQASHQVWSHVNQIYNQIYRQVGTLARCQIENQLQEELDGIN